MRADDSTKGFALAAEGKDFTSSRDSTVTMQSVGASAKIIRNGDPEYPRWDGAAWLFEVRQGGTQPAVSGAGAAPGKTGRLYVRNLTGAPVTVRILDAKGAPVMDTYWSFAAYEHAGDPREAIWNCGTRARCS